MMARTQFEQAMHSFLRRQPFQPFVIEFDNGEQWLVDKPETVFHYAGDNALYFRPDGSFAFVDCDTVRQLREPTLTPAS